MSEEDRERFNKYIQHAKKLVSEGNVADALRYNKKALKICHKEKLARKIKKMEVLLLWIFLCFFSVLFLLCLCASLFICALWSPAGKG